MPTVIIGSALDIVEHCGVARFLFVDFPLGNPCGKPWDADMQLRIVRHGLSLLDQARRPMTTDCSPEIWGEDGWRDRYMQVTEENRAELARMGAELRSRRAQRRRRDETPD